MEDLVAVTRAIVGHQEAEIYALQADDDSLRDALVNRGDIVLLERCASAANGDMVAVRLLDGVRSTLRRVYFEDGHVRLQPENRRCRANVVPRENVEIQGRVLAIIRQSA